jgi:hypothetical protein
MTRGLTSSKDDGHIRIRTAPSFMLSHKAPWEWEVNTEFVFGGDRRAAES